jgi:hypothetical protein
VEATSSIGCREAPDQQWGDADAEQERSSGDRQEGERGGHLLWRAADDGEHERRRRQDHLGNDRRAGEASELGGTGRIRA